MTRALVVVAIVALPSWARGGEATVEEKLAAETLFAEGRALMEEGRYAEACAKFDGSNKIDPALGTILNLADCYERVGRTASAFAWFNEAVIVAEKTGDESRLPVAHERARALEPRLSRLTILVPEECRAEGLAVMRDGSLLVSAVFGAAIPVDPGSHTVSVTAPLVRDWSTTIDVEAGNVTAVVEVPPPGSKERPRLESPQAQMARRQRTAGAWMTVGGVAMLGASATVFWCDSCGEPTKIVALALGAPLGASLLIVGVVSLFASAPATPPSTPSYVAPVVGPSSVGVVVGGGF